LVEGVGTAFGRRMTDVLEAQTGIEHLNFGTAGGFSSLQELFLYEDLASRFDHDLVLLFHFPNNDFLENDPDHWWGTDRYRPYLVRGSDGDFTVRYPVDFGEARARERAQLWWNRWYNAFFVYRFASWLEDQITSRSALSKVGTAERGYAGYVNYTELGLERLFYSYRKLPDAAGGRRLVIFSIPRLSELEYARRPDVSGALPKRLAEFARGEPGIEYVDLLPGFLSDAQTTGHPLGDYFIPCDGHWSDLGNALAAAIVLQSVDLRSLVARRRG